MLPTLRKGASITRARLSEHTHTPVLVIEWRHSSHQLEDEDTKRPPVCSTVVSLLQNDLGSEVLGSATQGVRLAARRELLCEAKVRDFEVSGGINQQVLWLQVTARSLG